MDTWEGEGGAVADDIEVIFIPDVEWDVEPVAVPEGPHDWKLGGVPGCSCKGCAKAARRA